MDMITIAQNTVPVFLTPEQAALFVLFQQYYPEFGFMVSSGVFDVKNGSATLHFDKVGSLLRVEKNINVYRDK